MPTKTSKSNTSIDSRTSGIFVGLAVVRTIVSAVAIPLAPILIKSHPLVLVALRPTKEVLLIAGFFIRRGSLSAHGVVLAALPLLVGGVWLFFALGRVVGPLDKIDNRIVKKLLPSDKVKDLQKILKRKGERLVFIGRLAAFPSSLLAAAAGSGKTKWRKFAIADGLGALASIVEIVGLGYLLGFAYKKAGPIVTVIGLVALVAGAVWLGRALKRESD